MKQYLLSVMKGQSGGFFAQVIICLLWPFSCIYRLGIYCHRSFYSLKGVYKAPKPVISIGNITVGGVGKTPLVIWLARILKSKGLTPVVLIRGFMLEANVISDEAQMFSEQIPDIAILTGANRINNIKNNTSLTTDVYICDDALQHWPIDRDLDIVAIDAINPFGNGHLLPAGILREPLTALSRADVVVLTKTNASTNYQVLTSKLKEYNPNALLVETCYKSTGCVDVLNSEIMPLDFLKDKTVAAFCAIGDSSSFEWQIKNLGAELAKCFVFMDHHVYHKQDVQILMDFVRTQNIQVLVTTHKDAVKLRVFKELFVGIRLIYISIELDVTKGSDEFIQKVIAICHH